MKNIAMVSAGMDLHATRKLIEEVEKETGKQIILVEDPKEVKEVVFPIHPYDIEEMSAMAHLCHATLPKGEKRILRHYNPETDKQPDRNSPCKCGSGKKFKKCCINKDR